MLELKDYSRNMAVGLAVTCLAVLTAVVVAAQESAARDADVEAQRLAGGRGEAGGAVLHLRLGQALRELGRDEEALDELRAAVGLAPKDAQAHFQLGALLGDLARDEEAISELETAASLAPEDGAVQYELGEALRRSGRLEDSLGRFARAVELDPPGENASLGEAEALVELGRYREARERLEAAKVLLQESRSVDFGLAWLLAACPDPELRDGARALELAQSVFAARRSVAAAELVAAAQAESGDCEGAARTQSVVVEQAAGFDQPPEIMGRLERSLERFEGGPPCGAPAFGSPTERPSWPRRRGAGAQEANPRPASGRIGG